MWGQKIVRWGEHKNKKELRLTYQWLFQLQNKFRKIPLLVMYYLAKFDDMINIRQFFQLFQKLHLLNLQTISKIISCTVNVPKTSLKLLRIIVAQY